MRFCKFYSNFDVESALQEEKFSFTFMHLCFFIFVKQNLDISQDRCEQLNLRGEILDQDHSEPLEEILKRVQFNKINLEGASLNDEVILQKYIALCIIEYILIYVYIIYININNSYYRVP